MQLASATCILPPPLPAVEALSAMLCLLALCECMLRLSRSRGVQVPAQRWVLGHAGLLSLSLVLLGQAKAQANIGISL